MYTMVLMMAVTSGGDVASFGHHRNKGCDGNQASCQGAGYIGHAGNAGCTGTVASGFGSADAGCHGGGKGGFLGLRGKLFGGRNKSSSCHGSAHHGGGNYAGSCHGSLHQGYAPGVSTGCTGGVIHMPAAPTPPVIMPKTEDPKIKPKTQSN